MRRARTAEQPELYALRHRVFVEEQGVPLELERDEEDARAIHVLARRAGQVLGCGRLVLHGQEGKVGRIAVAPAARRAGVGLAVMQALTEEARALGVTELYLDAQVQVEGFYARQGYLPEGPRFQEAGIEHQRMRRRL